MSTDSVQAPIASPMKRATLEDVLAAPITPINMPEDKIPAELVNLAARFMVGPANIRDPLLIESRVKKDNGDVHVGLLVARMHNPDKPPYCVRVAYNLESLPGFLWIRPADWNSPVAYRPFTYEEALATLPTTFIKPKHDDPRLGKSWQRFDAIEKDANGVVNVFVNDIPFPLQSLFDYFWRTDSEGKAIPCGMENKKEDSE